jgi:hypothetical protein
MAALSATAAGPRDRATADDGGPGVVRVRRGGGGVSGGRVSGGGVGVTRSPRAVAAQAIESEEVAEIALSGSITSDPGSPDTLVDTDPASAGLPDSEPGEPGRGGATRGEQIEFFDIGVRGKRSGRTIILWGAEFAFVNCEIAVTDGLPVGYTGAIGQVGPNPGSASMMQFTLETGGEITLTVQPATSGNPSAPQRPVRTLTMQVP